MSGLPEGWVWTTLGECFRWSSGGTPRRTVAEYFDGNIPWAVIGDLNDGLVTATHASITEEGLANSAAKWVVPGSVLLAMYGSIGKLGIAGTAVTTNQAIAHTDPKPLPARFLFWYLRSIRSKLMALGKGGTQKNISQTVIKTVPFPLAPLPEQHRIVAKLESLFADLDEGVAALKRAQANLKRYRASMLKAAVEGRLTERWRIENPPEETGEELLARILSERRKRWEEEQRAKFTAKGRKPPRNWKAKYKEPIAPDTSGLPSLPEGWCWASFEALCRIQLGKMLSRVAREGRENRRPYLRNSNVRWFSIDSTDLKSMSFKASELEKFAVRPGDLLICEGGEPGRCSVYRGAGDVLMYQKALHRARANSDEISTEYLQYCLAHQVAHGIGMPRYSETTIRHLTLEKIKAIPLPVAPANEQRRIARMVAAHRQLADHLSGAITTTSLRNAAVLRQSILQRAFAGCLVPQDPADEPASVRLERIRAEREAAHARRKRRPKRVRR